MLGGRTEARVLTRTFGFQVARLIIQQRRLPGDDVRSWWRVSWPLDLMDLTHPVTVCAVPCWPLGSRQGRRGDALWKDQTVPYFTAWNIMGHEPPTTHWRVTKGSEASAGLASCPSWRLMTAFLRLKVRHERSGGHEGLACGPCCQDNRSIGSRWEGGWLSDGEDVL